VVVGILVHHVKCTMLLVQIAERKPKFRSNQMVTDQSTAGTVIRNIGQRDSKVDIYLGSFERGFFFFFSEEGKTTFYSFFSSFL
jgi:hypothetical protein